MDNQLINSVYDTIKDDPKVISQGKQNVKNTLASISMKLLQDTHKADTLSVLSVYCAMNGIKNTFKPTRFYIRTRPYTEE